MWSGWCGDGLGRCVICMIRPGMAWAHTSLLYILERLNGEGAWVVRPLMFSLSKTASLWCWHVEQTVQDVNSYTHGCNGVKLVLYFCDINLVRSS